MPRLRAVVVPFLALALLGTAPARVADAAEFVCDQPNNTSLFCTPNANPCVISGTFDVPGGCNLDAGNRAIRFQGTFNVHAGVLTVRATGVTIDGRVEARPTSGRAGSLFLTSNTDFVMTDRGRLDASGNSAGLVRVIAVGLVDLRTGSQLNAKGVSSSPNTASGGSIDVLTFGTINGGASVDVTGGSGGGGGSLTMQAGGNVTVTQPINADGGIADGGDVDISAGDDISVTRPIGVSSLIGGGSGGGIRIRAGIDNILGSQKPGGALSVVTNLTSDGSSDAESGYDGGDIVLTAFGNVLFDGEARANGSSPDGGGGSFMADSSDSNLGQLTARDGELRLRGSIETRSVGFDSDGGDFDVDAGTDLFLEASVDVSAGAGGGDITTTAARDTTITGRLSADATDGLGSGGSISLKTGSVLFGTMSIGALSGLDAAGGANGNGGDALALGCNLAVAPSVVVDTSGNGARIDLGAIGSFTLGASSRYLARTTGKVFLNHPPNVTPVIGQGVVFDPERVDIDTTSAASFPACPVCGDGTVEGGEVCDDDNTQNGDCCDATCSAVTCATPTPTATPTKTATPTPTKSATPTATLTATATATVTSTPEPTVTPTATGPTPTITGVTPTPTVSATATTTTTPTASETATPVVTATLSPTVTGTRTPTPVATAQLPVIVPKVLIKCQSALGKNTVRFVLSEAATLESCALATFTCLQKFPAGEKRDSCIVTSGSRCDKKFARIDAARSAFNESYAKACGGAPPLVPLALLRAPEGLDFVSAEPVCRDEVGLALTSNTAIGACVQFGSACEVERAVSVGIPRIGDLLSTVADVGALGLCVPQPTGNTDGLLDVDLGRRALRCQKAVVTAGRGLLRRQLATARSCVDSLFKCRLSGTDCSRAAQRCDARLDALRATAPVKLAQSVGRGCGELPMEALLDNIGVGFEDAAARCATLGVSPLDDHADAAACVSRAYGCAGTKILRYALPMIDAELARVGQSLGDDLFCGSGTSPSPTATPTPVVTATATLTTTPTATATETATPSVTATPDDPTPTPTSSATPTEAPTDEPTPTATETPAATETATPTETPIETPDPTVTPTATTEEPTPTAEEPTPTLTPTPSPTATATTPCGDGMLDPGEQCDLGDAEPGDGCSATCQFEHLIPGGGSRVDDCIGEWTVINPLNDPFLGSDGLTNARQTCVDGDPLCDADGAVNDECRFQVALCFTVSDPQLPECAVTTALTRYRLLEPTPSTGDPTGTANAMALLQAIEAFTGTAVNPNSWTFTFDPPVLATPPDNCTELFDVVVPLTQTEHFRTRVFAVPPSGTGNDLDDNDDLRLTCARP